MENTEKLKNSKEVIAYIAECFPKCFTLEGEAKPLKIGIFQDLAERLSDDPKISKTQIRAALRQYTSSWRYLRGVKPGADRVDLDGNSCGTLEQEHIDHAQNVLVESKARARDLRKEKEKVNQANNVHKADKSGSDKPSSDKTAPNKTAFNKTKVKKPNYKAKSPKNGQENKVQARALTSDELVTGHQVRVNMGKGNMVATIVEINKEDVRVQLANGLQMVVKAEHLCA